MDKGGQLNKSLTWTLRDKGYVKPTFSNPVAQLQVPSNVTRIARAFAHVCQDNTVQIINYQCGVGTGGTLSDIYTGGALGKGIAEVLSSLSVA